MNNEGLSTLDRLIGYIENIIGFELFKIGSNIFTAKTILILGFSFALLLFLSERIRKFLVNRVFPKYNIDIGVSQAVAAIIKYILLIIGFVVIIQTSGIDLSAIGLLIGALGVGIGFGLQNITNNFISGLIILFERPVKVGDRVEIDGLTGNIVKISARATTIITNDHIAVIVPNSDLIDKRVVNWSHNNKQVRLNISVGVAYKEDPDNISNILTEIAKEHPGVLPLPSPYVRFDEFADSSINFTLQVWTIEYVDRPMILKSELYYKIFRAFRDKGIEIPFPQTDVYLK